MLAWTTQDDVAYVPEMRTQLVAARSVAEELVRLAVDASATPPNGSGVWEVAGPREESMVEMANLLATQSGAPSAVQGVSDAKNPDRGEYEGGALLPGRHARLSGPTFSDWLQTAT